MKKRLQLGSFVFIVMVLFTSMISVSVMAAETIGENEQLPTSEEQALITESLNTYGGGTQTAIFPMENLKVSQITHPETASDAVDFCGINTGSENVFAPFDAVVVQKMTASVMGNTVVIQSRSPVKYADGTVDFMTVSVTHDNDISDLWVGKNLTKGEVFYQEGTAGYATGNHIHMICARGQYGVNTIWDHSLAVNGLTNSLWPDKALFISNRTKIIYSWWFNWVADLPQDTELPAISNIRITDVNAEGFTVRCNVADNVGVTKVNYATWTDANGQDDLKWADGSLSGSDSSYRVLYGDHNNERGSYKVDIRAYDAANNCAGPITTGTTIDATPPTITDVEILNQTSLGYTVKCKVSDASGIDRVQFPTWTSVNNQDDINKDWQTSAAASGTIDGDTVTYTVKDSDHSYERGEYNTHIYAYDKFGNFKCYELKTTVENNWSILSEETLNNHRYMLYDDAVTWSQAEAKAEELGGTLVTISSQEEQTLVEKLIGAGKRDRYFMGGTDEGQEGKFRWVTGEPFGLAKWAPGNPDNSAGNENYLQMTRESYWNDIAGTYAAGGYIVEVDLGALHISGFTADPTSGQYTNGKTDLSADISGGVGPFQYKFYYQLGDATTTIQDFSEANNAIFKPTAAGTYTLFVDVKDSEGRTATKSIPDYVIQKNIGIAYQTQIENVGWQDSVANGDISGTSGQGLRLEGIKISLDKQGYDLGVTYQTHIQNVGWEADTDRGWKSNGIMSGTEGLGYRLEAIQIKLTGADADKFDIYYQVHAQNFGWLDWAKNGASAGTAGFGNRLEAINIVVVPKDAAAPGETDRSFVQN